MPKLPADLPENWTQGQTISPNGTEVGLTEKHGYNYLMKQVNDTQTEVNDINTALTDVAQQATVEEINNKIGEESDADTQPTLFGRLAQLKKVLLEKLAELLTKVTRIDGKIGTIGDAAGEESLVGLIKGVNESVKNGEGFYRYSKTDIKKHIQKWTLLPAESSIQDVYGKLTTIHAEKNGTCYVKINSTDLGTISFGVYDKIPYQAVVAADQSKLVGLKGFNKKTSEAWFFEAYNVNSSPCTEEREWIIPVEAGKDYTLLIIGSSVRQCIINDFILGYTDAKEA